MMKHLGLLLFLGTSISACAAEKVSVPVDGKDLVTYQAAPLSNPVGGDKFRGSNFIHPLATPSGFTVTESQPKDHPHHFGLWWPWKFIESEGRQILCWELQNGDGIVEAKSSKPTSNGLITESVYIDRKAPGGPRTLLNETTRLTVSGIFNEPAHGYFLDLEIDHQVAGDQPLTISKYRYSGFAIRATPVWNKDNSTLLTSEGEGRAAANSSQARWVRAEGTNGKDGTAGVLLMGHPDNHSHPEKIRTWNEHYNGAIFINFNPVMAEPWIFQPNKTYTRNYRVFVYDGSLTADEAETLWKSYASEK